LLRQKLPKPKGKAPKKEEAIGRQPDLFSSAMQQPIHASCFQWNKTFNGKKQEAIGDLFSQKTGMAKLISQPFPYLLMPFPNLRRIVANCNRSTVTIALWWIMVGSVICKV
jgi:hypothetical protein